jgi:hypothetical protein
MASLLQRGWRGLTTPAQPLITASWVVILVVACGRADGGDRAVRTNDEPGREVSSPTRPDASPARDDDAGAPAPASECPAPLVNAVQNAQSVWVRNPSTGDCCGYAPISAAPSTWPLFFTEEECRDDCRCAIGENGQVQYRASIECICSVEDCPSSIEVAEQRLCNDSSSALEPAVQRFVGCGMVMVVDRNGYSGVGWVFEQPLESTGAAPGEPRLVGSSKFSDATSEACTPDVWGAGRDFFECEEVVTCQLCGDSPGPDFPPCE